MRQQCFHGLFHVAAWLIVTKVCDALAGQPLVGVKRRHQCIDNVPGCLTASSSNDVVCRMTDKASAVTWGVDSPQLITQTCMPHDSLGMCHGLPFANKIKLRKVLIQLAAVSTSRGIQLLLHPRETQFSVQTVPYI